MVRRMSGRAGAGGRVRVAALVLALAALAGCGGGRDVASMMESARTAISKKQNDAARITLKNVLQQKPEHAEARFLLGQLLLEGGDAAGAEVELRRALEQQHPRAKVVPALATALLAQNKGGVLLQQFAGMRLDDADADVRLQTSLATAEAAGGNLPAATARVDAVLRSRPDDQPAALLRARLSAAGGQLADAQAQVDQLLARHADNAEAWQFKGDLLRQTAAAAGVRPGTKQATSPAADAYREAVKRRPGNLAVLAALVGMHLADGDLAGAEAQWKAMQKAAPQHPQTVLLEAALAGKRGDYKRARELSQQVLRVLPDNAQALLVAAEAEQQLGNLQQAEALFAKVLQRTPGNAPLRLQLAGTQLRSGQTDKTLATLAPLLDGNGASVEALTMAAQAQLIKGDAAAADASLARAARLKPDDLRVRMAMALSSVSKGKGPQAVAELRAVAAADKGINADLALVDVLLRAKDTAGALKAVDALAAKMPNDSLADMLRGRIALMTKDNAGARGHFEAALKRHADYMPAVAGLAALDATEGKLPEAKARFEALLKQNPKNAPALMALAELTARGGGTPDAVGKLLADALAADPANVRARVALVDHQLANNQAKAAVDTLRAGLLTSPEQPELLERQGRVMMANGDAIQAVAAYGKLAAVLPRSPVPQLRLAEAQLAARNTAGAAAALRKAAEIAPDNLQVMQAQVNQALLENRVDQALAIARKLQARAPDEAVGYAMEGGVEMRRRNWDAAVTVLRKAVTRNRPGDAGQRLYTALLGSGKTADADAFAQDWRKRYPDDMAFVQNQGDQAMAAGQYAQAEAAYRVVLEKLPDAVLALNNLAFSLAAQKKPGGVPLAEKAAKLAPRNAAVLDTLANALAADKQLEKAVDVQKKVVEMAPEVMDYRLGLARLLLQSGDKLGARTELTRLAAQGSKYPRQAEVQALLKGGEKAAQ